MPGTILNLWGSSGTGKTAVRQMMEAGRADLLDVPILREAIGSGFGQFAHEDCLHIRDEIWAGQSPRSIFRQAVERGFGDRDWLLNDTGITDQSLIEQADCRKVLVALFAYPWLVQARRDVRYRMYPDDPGKARTDGILPDRALVEAALGWKGAETVLVDASDYPLRQITADEALALVETPETAPELPARELMYQQCLWIRGEPYGTAEPWRQEWERARLDNILPDDLTGLTVLDVGASEGGMCYEALHRGAYMATAVEIRPSHVEICRRIRTACRLPVVSAHLDIAQQELPPAFVTITPVRYGVGLLLNVLHHFAEPEPLFRKVLRACERVIVESPFFPGRTPLRPGLAPYPNAMHLPPTWVECIGRSEGFCLTAMRNSNMSQGQRMVFDLQRCPADSDPDGSFV